MCHSVLRHICGSQLVNHLSIVMSAAFEHRCSKAANRFVRWTFRLNKKDQHLHRKHAINIVQIFRNTTIGLNFLSTYSPFSLYFLAEIFTPSFVIISLFIRACANINVFVYFLWSENVHNRISGSSQIKRRRKMDCQSKSRMYTEKN